MPRAALFAIMLGLGTPLVAASDPLVPIAEAKRGTFVTVEGDVTRILDEDTFRLADSSGDIRIYIGPNRLPVRPGDRVSVNGFVDDDLGPREIYADVLTREDGTVITFERRYD